MAYQGPQSSDIRATLTITQAEAMSGTCRQVNLPSGRQVTVPIPPGTYNGQEITLPGQGEQTWSGGPSGSLILTIAVATTSYPVNQGGSDAYLATERASQGSIPPPPAPGTGSTYPYTNYPPQSSAYPPYAGSQPAAYPSYGGEQQNAYPPYGSAQPSAYPQYGDAQPSMYPQYGTAQGMSQNSTTPRRGLSGGAIFLIVLLVVVVGGGLLSYVLLVHPGSNNGNQQTRNGGGTTTPAPAGTPDLYTQSTSGAPTITAALNAQDGNNWDVDHQTSGSSCQFANSQYHVTAGQAQDLYPCYMGSVFSNFAFTVQMTITRGDYGGIIFRADSATSKYYYFRIGQDGNYALKISKDTSFSSDQVLKTGNAASLFKTGLNQVNEVAVIAKGTAINLYVNQKLLSQVTDSTYAAGRIAVFAGDDASPTADVAYSNAKLWNL